MNSPPRISWCRTAAPDLADLEIALCPTCAEAHRYDPQGPCQNFDLYEAPPELLVELERLAAIPEPWLVINGQGMVDTRHADLSSAHTRLLELIKGDPFGRLVNERLERLRVLTEVMSKVCGQLVRAN